MLNYEENTSSPHPPSILAGVHANLVGGPHVCVWCLLTNSRESRHHHSSVGQSIAGTFHPGSHGSQKNLYSPVEDDTIMSGYLQFNFPLSNLGSIMQALETISQEGKPPIDPHSPTEQLVCSNA